MNPGPRIPRHEDPDWSPEDDDPIEAEIQDPDDSDDADDCCEEQAALQEQIFADLASDTEDFARSEEEGWYYLDDD